MKVKIGPHIFDSKEQMILLILDEEEKTHLANMGESTKYCVAPDDTSEEDMKQFMAG